ncbi:MAG: DNA polymerase I, partial [Fervidobacterium sp.]
MARVFLFDGTGLIYRAYFAIDSSLSTTKGIPTNALYGLARMLLKFIKENLKIEHDYCAFVLDVKGGSTYRKQLFTEYKSNRPETPEPLLQQIDLVDELVEAFGVKVVKIPGYEADDVIATLAKYFEKNRYKYNITEVNVITSDKDMLQLVNDFVFVWRVEKGVSEIKKYALKDVKERYGILPHQIKDYLSLVGDPSDNIPGVPGIGEKTAVKILNDFGSVEDAFKHLDEISERIRETLKNYRNDYDLSKNLVELNTSLEITFEVSELLYNGFDKNKLLDVLKKYEFSSVIKELELSTNLLKNVEYTVVDDPKIMSQLKEEISKSKKIAFDLETTSLDPFAGKIVGLAIAVDEGKAYYIPVSHVGAKNVSQVQLKEILEILFDGTRKIGGHNIKFDIKFLKKLGIEVDGIAFETMLEAYLLNPNEKRFNLDELTLKILGHKMISYKELMQNSLPLFNGDISYVPVENAAKYSCEDADMSLRLHNIFNPLIYDHGMKELYEKIEIPMIYVLAQMELNGVYFDIKYLSELSVEMNKKLSTLAQRIFELSGESFNINSPKQLGYILFEKLKLPSLKSTTTGAYSTDVEVLEYLSNNYEIARLLLEYRKIQKLKSAYVDAIPALVNKITGRIHASFNQTGTATGRLSSSDPNLQNLPGRTEEGKEIRMAVKPQNDSWYILGADYSQIELRVLAHITEDPELIKAFTEGRDIHTETAKKIFNVSDEFITENMRRIGKMVNFAIVYGVSPYGLSKRLSLDVKETRKIIESYLTNYKNVQEYMTNIKEFAKKNGYVTTIFGRRRD